MCDCYARVMTCFSWTMPLHYWSLGSGFQYQSPGGICWVGLFWFLFSTIASQSDSLCSNMLLISIWCFPVNQMINTSDPTQTTWIKPYKAGAQIVMLPEHVLFPHSLFLAFKTSTLPLAPCHSHIHSPKRVSRHPRMSSWTIILHSLTLFHINKNLGQYLPPLWVNLKVLQISNL